METLALFEKECIEKEIDYFVEDVEKVDPKTKNVIWAQKVAFPKTVDGFVEMISEKRSHSFLCDKLKIWLRQQNDPRKPEKSFTIDGVKYTESDLRQFIESKKTGS